MEGKLAAPSLLSWGKIMYTEVYRDLGKKCVLFYGISTFSRLFNTKFRHFHDYFKVLHSLIEAYIFFQ